MISTKSTRARVRRFGRFVTVAHTFRLANAACPYPFHFRSATGEVEEMQVEAYPLGVREGTVYTAIETELEPGDRIIFCSDGIAESTNAEIILCSLPMSCALSST